MEKIFKALSDPHRIKILDALREKDGQTSSDLEKKLQPLSRFGVMKHLGVLEENGLITTHKEGRFKYHYLNPVPIQEVADRWISRFATPWVQGMNDLKQQLEGKNTMSNKPKHIYNTIIQTSADKLWDALTNPQLTSQYFFGLSVKTDWKVGSAINFNNAEGKSACGGLITEIIPQQKLAYTFNEFCTPEEKDCCEPNEKDCCPTDEGGDTSSRVTIDIEPLGDNAVKMTLTHDDFEKETTTFVNVGNGWPTVISGLKTYLETGKPLEIEAA